MKHGILITTIVTTALISGCGLFSRSKPSGDAERNSIKTQKDKQYRNTGETTPLQTTDFNQGVSSVTVERLAAQNQCTSKQGAALATPKGPTEVYKVSCDDGRVFMAKCELRQCQPMMAK